MDNLITENRLSLILSRFILIWSEFHLELSKVFYFENNFMKYFINYFIIPLKISYKDTERKDLDTH